MPPVPVALLFDGNLLHPEDGVLTADQTWPVILCDIQIISIILIHGAVPAPQ